ncbi:Protein DPCD [Frankliniella fusca]|uniref:Protein DPCD n=1 Tax=Frankliniella fusca TaxID=407009 RepID=A0AAE1H0E1_9NEOP|nr:Protein DPCD [Frankliniella fusca]
MIAVKSPQVSVIGDNQMSASSNWIPYLSAAKKSCLVENGVRKVHYNLPDGKEMVEEYNLQTDVLQRRMWKVSDTVRGEKWNVEVGDQLPQFDNLESVGIQENATAPMLTKRITKTNIEWRIRNLPYARDVYSVTADTDGITVRTSNKKYFKKIDVPELARVGLLADSSLLSYTHQFNTLIITYKKPPKVLEMESKILEMVKAVSPTKVPDIKNAPDQCKPS